MPFLKNRQDAGRLLAEALKQYQGKEIIVLGLPRGGVVTAAEIASSLGAPLDLALAGKIGHPQNEEYAVAAVSESGHLVGNPHELEYLGTDWLKKRKQEVIEKMQQRRNAYLKGKSMPDLKDKIVILVDDGIATGLTMQAAIKEVKGHHPQKCIVAIPMAPQSTADLLRSQVDELIALRIDPDEQYLGGVGAYYEEFQQVSDEQVKELL